MPPKVNDLNDPESQQDTVQPKAPRPRKPNLATAIKQAARAGIKVSGATLEADGRISLTFGESTNADGGTNLDDWIMKNARTPQGHK